MGELESIRAHLSHFILRNGILARLGITSDILSAAPNDRPEQITRRLLEIDVMSANHIAALKAWYGGPGYEPGVRKAVAELLAVVSQLRSLRPTSRFPTTKAVDSWLEEMECFLESLKRFPDLSIDDRQRMARNFARGVACLLDFLSHLDVDSDEFRVYFERY